SVLTSTSPRPGCGTGTSSTTSWLLRKTTARIGSGLTFHGLRILQTGRIGVWNILVHANERGADRFPGKLRADGSAGRRSNGMAKCCIAEKFANGIGDSLGIVGIDEQAAAAVCNEFRNNSHSCGHHRNRGGHGLDDAYAKGFVERRANINIRGFIERWNI